MRELAFSLPYLKFNFVLSIMLSTSLGFPQESMIALMDDSSMIFIAEICLTRERRGPQAKFARYPSIYILDVDEDREEALKHSHFTIARSTPLTFELV
ncbi:MAG TPA: hypothetical protein VHS97_08430, partial [Isosphaeraceae bacterium]|nr:hypothetical protein [Isosphaeraceae bacterium]